jgi:hypothetical protein
VSVVAGRVRVPEAVAEAITVVVPEEEPLTVRLPLSVKLATEIVPVKVGLTENTKEPEPVSSEIKVARFALVGLAAKNVATPEPSPLIPVLIGNPVALVNTP